MPRSPSRDLSDRYIGRRGYFRNPDAIRKGKYALSFIALFAVFAWAVIDVVQPSKAAYGHSHGPLANPHAAFDDNCSACHASYSAGDFGPISMFNARERWHKLTCDKCHSGPGHHASATPEGAARHEICSNCHHDHNGRTFSLVRLNDRDCNACHENLAKWHDPTKSLSGKDGGPYANKVTSFVTDHPGFRSLGEQKEPNKDDKPNPTPRSRTLTFSHAVHMNPGQAYSPDGKEAMTVRNLRALSGQVAVDRYAPGVTDENAKIQLNCASCHTLDAGIGEPGFDAVKGTLGKGDPTASLLPARAEGAYFLSVNFESHCRSCHPLAANEGTNKTNDARLILPRFDLPHRKQTHEVREFLRAGYVNELIKTGQLPQLAPLAQPGLPPEAVKDERTNAFRTEVDRLTGAAEKALFTGGDGCAKCHTKENVDKPAPGAPVFRIAPVADRTVWLTHAKFNHASHRGATCNACHPGTKARTIDPVEAAKPEPVQILGLLSCRTCHSPTSTRVSVEDEGGVEIKTSGGGVRSNCTDCHRYHHGDHPMQGRGAASWFPKQPREIADWLRGK